MVRPEAWRIADAGSPGLPATIENTTFVGDRLLLRAATPAGPQVLSLQGFASLAVGDRIALDVAPDLLQLIDMQHDSTSPGDTP
jgi:hypothetical protein